MDQHDAKIGKWALREAAKVALGLAFALVGILGSRTAHAAEIWSQLLNDSNHAAFSGSPFSFGTQQLEDTGYATTGYVNTFGSDTSVVTSVSWLVKNTGGSTCTASLNYAGDIYYCNSDSNCTGGSRVFDAFDTCDAVNVAAGSEQWVECTLSTPIGSPQLNRVWFVNGPVFQSPSGCGSTFARYWNADVAANSHGAAGSSTDTSLRICSGGTDCGAAPAVPPVISNVDVDPDLTSAVITWDTDDASDTTACWGLTAESDCIDYDHNGTVVESVTSHEFVISSGLTPGTTYHFIVCSEDGDGETCTSDDTFATDGADPVAAPSAFFYDPPPGRIFGPGILEAYTFRVATNVDSVTYPDESLVFDYQIYEDDETTLLYDNPALPLLLDNSVICGAPGDCTRAYYVVLFQTPYEFAEAATYKLRVRAKTVSGGTYGAWSTWLDVTVQLTVPACDFWGATSGDGLACLWSWTQWLFTTPASGALGDAVDALRLRIVTRWPVAYFFDTLTAVTDGLADETPACPLPTVPDEELDDGVTLPGFNPCLIIDNATALLDADGDIQDWGAKIIYLAGVIAVVFVGFKLFKT